MAIYKDQKTGKWVIKVRDAARRQHVITVNTHNALKYGLSIDEPFSKTVARKLEKIVYAKFFNVQKLMEAGTLFL